MSGYGSTWLWNPLAGAAEEELQIGVQLGQGSVLKKKKKKKAGFVGRNSLVDCSVSMRGLPPQLDYFSSAHVRHLKRPLLLFTVHCFNN